MVPGSRVTLGNRHWSGAGLCIFALLSGLGAQSAAAADTERGGRPTAPLTIEVAGSELTLERLGPALAAGDHEMRDWVERSATIVRQYYGYFPVKRLTLRVTTAPGAAVGSGHTRAEPSAVIDISVGQDVTPQALHDDWVLVHEMIHLALPDLGSAHNWLAEGIATYVEGVARAQAGNMSDADLWREYAMQMPKGLPGPGDRGLDHTHTWARTYWGGALFCLLADVKIRDLTRGRAGLQDALRTIGRDGGMTTDGEIERVLAAGDAATGTTVLRDLYAAMKDEPMMPDLAHLWRQLGIRLTDESVDFDDAAPLASVRRRITAPASAAGSSPDRSRS